MLLAFDPFLVLSERFFFGLFGCCGSSCLLCVVVLVVNFGWSCFLIASLFPLLSLSFDHIDSMNFFVVFKFLVLVEIYMLNLIICNSDVDDFG